MRRLLLGSVLALGLATGCSLSRWEAENGHTRVRHGLVIRFGTELYIGDDGHGETAADWTAEGAGRAEEPDPAPAPTPDTP